ncbi:unnamed protein product [Nezara viridula]|uniref:C2 domain-containing protein n=1 Tax=Nezara viridula TaxID=85310 RepID=A0A9P0HB80_NEZVI|nr:unnamed protein product [Nezara viridula]
MPLNKLGSFIKEIKLRLCQKETPALQFTWTTIQFPTDKLHEGCKDETFVRLTLNQHWNTVKVKRTSVVRSSTDPQYSQGFNFRVSTANVDVTSLSLQVLQPPIGYGKGE